MQCEQGRHSFRFEAYREALARFRGVRSALRCPPCGSVNTKSPRADIPSGLAPDQLQLRRGLLLQADVAQLMALYQLRRYDSLVALAERIHSGKKSNGPSVSGRSQTKMIHCFNASVNLTFFICLQFGQNLAGGFLEGPQ